MCGIAGFFGNTLCVDADIYENINKMASSIEHRGPDDGEVRRVDQYCIMAHRRLAIVDLTSTGRQPMQSRNARYTIVYNGEIYNYLHLKSELKEVDFIGRSDTEVLIEYISKYGIEKAFSVIDGMFAIALYDKYKNELILAIDHFGQKPLYYSTADQGYYFSSDLASFMSIGFREIDNDAISEFMIRGSIAAPNSFLHGVKKLEPGTYVRISADGSIKITSYFNIEELIYEGCSGGTNEDRLSLDFENILYDYLQADVNVSIFLSGGLDSSLIAAAANNISKGSVNCLTFSFEDPSYDESENAMQVAQYLGVNCEKLSASKEMVLKTFIDMGRCVTEPNADQAIIPTMMLSKLASDSCKVALVGDGGDELFDGYHKAHAYVNKLMKCSRFFPKIDLNNVQGILQPLSPSIQSAIIRRLLCIDKNSTISAANLYEKRFLGNPFDRFGSYINIDKIINNDHYGDNLALMDYKKNLPSRMLPKLDKASMAYSLELRAPFLSTRFIQRKISSVGFGNEKRRSQKIMADKYFPAGYFEKPKKGFSVPVGSWIKLYLFDYYNDLLGCTPEIDRYFDRKKIAERLRRHVSGKDDSAFLYPVLQVLQLIKAHSLK
jgi:asparagine synthase (glutamine-hydrolysing)